MALAPKAVDQIFGFRYETYLTSHDRGPTWERPVCRCLLAIPVHFEE